MEGQKWSQQAKISAPDASPFSYFGISARLGEDIAVVGSFLGEGRAADSGSAYIFTKVSSSLWTFAAKLIAADGAQNDRFGFCVDINPEGNRTVISSHGNNHNRGKK